MCILHSPLGWSYLNVNFLRTDTHQSRDADSQTHYCVELFLLEPFHSQVVSSDCKWALHKSGEIQWFIPTVSFK